MGKEGQLRCRFRGSPYDVIKIVGLFVVVIVDVPGLPAWAVQVPMPVPAIVTLPPGNESKQEVV